jgi:hypothetical protein
MYFAANAPSINLNKKSVTPAFDYRLKTILVIAANIFLGPLVK